MLIAFSIWTCYSAVYAKTESNASGTAVIAMIFLFYGVAGAVWPGLTVSYTVEILPYNIRAKGHTLSLSGVFNQWVNPLGLESLHWRFYLVYIVSSLFLTLILTICFPSLVLECLIIFYFFPETKGPTLEEIGAMFDGEQSATGIAQAKAFEKVIAHWDTKRDA
ncbi:hypothetical protein N7481_008811 [Penicillium waksmanii]|uniref:uncharacterized protein n=1 Tax=Penicillium waksmanii TaxID=69791 RepID=UPI002546E1A8|nr:uncharacterized protein N7481_008811 [Penicillium waksmanii]KAJ5975104.1 hypothetical protein N7481_008811 [Penicillium waksmanii]